MLKILEQTTVFLCDSAVDAVFHAAVSLNLASHFFDSCLCFLGISDQICRCSEHPAPAHYLLLKVREASPGIVIVADARKGNGCCGLGSIIYLLKLI